MIDSSPDFPKTIPLSAVRNARRATTIADCFTLRRVLEAKHASKASAKSFRISNPHLFQSVRCAANSVRSKQHNSVSTKQFAGASDLRDVSACKLGRNPVRTDSASLDWRMALQHLSRARREDRSM